MPLNTGPHPEIYSARPACFSPEQWSEWVCAERDDAKQDGYQHQPSGYCTSCTLAHQVIMKARGSCPHPGTIFILDEDMQQVGIRQEVMDSLRGRRLTSDTI
jgi:hypothetical protein